MNRNEIDWGPGRVTFWEMDAIDVSRPLSEQTDELREDLAQIEYPNRVVIDIGWRPSFSENGAFVLVVIRNEDWEHPLLEERCGSMPALRSSLARAVLVATQRQR